MITVGCAHLPLPAAARFEPFLSHQSLHSLMIANLPLPSQLLGDPRTAIPLALGLKELLDLLGHHSIGQLARALLPSAPGIVAAAADVQRRTQFPDRIRLGLLFNHPVALL